MEPWFILLPYQQRLAFFLGLFKRCSVELIASFLSAILLSDGKERVYSISKTNPQLDDINEPPLRSIFKPSNADLSMIHIFLRFLILTDYQKKIIVLHFLKLCDDRLLAQLANQMHEIIFFAKEENRWSENENNSSGTEAPDEKVPPFTEGINLSEIHSTEPVSNCETEDDGFDIECEDFISSKIPVTKSRVSSKSKHNLRTIPSYFRNHGSKDLISSLPIGISKKIFGLLDKISITNCLCVSSSWRTLAEEVNSEVTIQSEVSESVKLMQVSRVLVNKNIFNIQF